MKTNSTQRILSGRTKSLQAYFTEINKVVLLSPEEEVELTKKIQAGDLEALERLTKANLRFVVSIAKEYQWQVNGLTVEDLINEGNIGLIKAAQRFDPTKGFKFISYAVWWIRQSILKAIYEEARMIRMPANRIAHLYKISKAFTQLEQQFEREPSNEELGKAVDLSQTEVRDLRQLESGPVSLDAPTSGSDDEKGISLLNFIEQQGVNLEKIVQNESLQMDLERVISSLNVKQQTITKLYFGIGTPRPYNLEEIGEHVGLTRERVRQIKDMAIKKMRKNGRATLLKKYL